MSMPDGSQRPPLRYKRFGGGYRREDVEFALAELRLTLRQLDNDLTSLHDRNRELEGELARTRSEIEAFRAKEHELWQTMSIALRRADEIEEGATARAREIVAQAEEAATAHPLRGQPPDRGHERAVQRAAAPEGQPARGDATRRRRLRPRDLRVGRGEQLFPGVMQDAAGEARPSRSGGRVAPSSRICRRPHRAGAGSVPLDSLLAPPSSRARCLGAGAPEPAPAIPLRASYAISIPAAPPPPTPLPASPAARISAARVPAARRRWRNPVFETRLELDAGPFSDFAALSAFERALAHLPKVEDVYVRRLADDRALIELTLNKVATLADDAGVAAVRTRGSLGEPVEDRRQRLGSDSGRHEMR